MNKLLQNIFRGAETLDPASPIRWQAKKESDMNYGRITERDREAILVNRMRDWQEVAERGIYEQDRARARRNLASLVRKHLDVAEIYGFKRE